MKRFRLAIFASGNGTNAEKIVNYFRAHPSIEVALILSNNPNAFVLQRARNLNLRSVTFTKDEFCSNTVVDHLKKEKVTHVVLAGFLWLIPHSLLKEFPGRIINLHPALLPKFGGKGMFGLKVHQAVKEAGEKETGITIHIVNEEYDDGKILFQKACPVEEYHSAEDIAECVHQLEYEYFPKVIERWLLGDQTSA
jgi:phosphoribosylglycinamide formyltransferase-1